MKDAFGNEIVCGGLIRYCSGSGWKETRVVKLTQHWRTKYGTSRTYVFIRCRRDADPLYHGVNLRNAKNIMVVV